MSEILPGLMNLYCSYLVCLPFLLQVGQHQHFLLLALPLMSGQCHFVVYAHM